MTSSCRDYNRSTIPFPSTSCAFLPEEPAQQSAGLFSDAEYAAMRAFFASRPDLTPTPTRRLGALAAELGLGAVLAKDETARFGLNAFKLLGARFTLDRLLAAGRLRPGATLACASEGNHGRAVARAARDAGCAARVYMAADAAQARVDAIAGEGAEVVRVAGSYDAAVRQVEQDAQAHGWTVISDTAWDGYEEIPRLIMLGYTRMMEEVGLALSEAATTARAESKGMTRCSSREAWAACCAALPVGARATVTPVLRSCCVEPTQAACLLASARAGHPVAVEGPLDTTMAGLRNREVSPLAFRAVQPIVNAYLGIDDPWAHQAMRRLGQPTGGDPVIAAGASGAAALGGLLAVMRDPALAPVRTRLALGPIRTGVGDRERGRHRPGPLGQNHGLAARAFHPRPASPIFGHLAGHLMEHPGPNSRFLKVLGHCSGWHGP